jgi:hypothetical protein
MTFNFGEYKDWLPMEHDIHKTLYSPHGKSSIVYNMQTDLGDGHRIA